MGKLKVQYLQHLIIFLLCFAGCENPLLFTAIKENNKEKVIELLNNGADVNYKARRGHTPLTLAVSLGNSPIVRILLEHGADINLKGMLGNTPLEEAIGDGSSKSFEIFLLLLEKGADTKGDNGSYALNSAISFEKSKMILKLLEHGTDVNFIPSHQKNLTALECAAMGKNLTIVKLLLDNGADINIRDKQNRTAVTIAAEWGHIDILKYLLSKKALVTENDINMVKASFKEGFINDGTKEIITEYIPENIQKEVLTLLNNARTDKNQQK